MLKNIAQIVEMKKHYVYLEPDGELWISSEIFEDYCVFRGSFDKCDKYLKEHFKKKNK